MKQIVRLEDQGQDFLEFHIENGKITESVPFQSWLWTEFEVIQKKIVPGMHLKLRRRGQKPVILKYPVVSVSPCLGG